MTKPITVGDLINPAFQALKQLDGTASNKQILETVLQNIDLSIYASEAMGKEQKQRIRYCLGWAKTNLIKHNLVVAPRLGWWSLTEKGKEYDMVSPTYILKNQSETRKLFALPLATAQHLQQLSQKLGVSQKQIVIEALHMYFMQKDEV